MSNRHLHFLSLYFCPKPTAIRMKKNSLCTYLSFTQFIYANCSNIGQATSAQNKTYKTAAATAQHYRVPTVCHLDSQTRTWTPIQRNLTQT